MVHFYTRLNFIIGIALGVLLAVYFQQFKINGGQKSRKNDFLYQKWFKKEKLSRTKIAWDGLRYSNKSYYLESEYLYNKVTILCIILVKHQKYLEAAKNTWIKGCNTIKPIVIETQNKIMPRKQSKDKSSWALLCNVLKSREISTFNWVLIVKDTTFVIMENLRLLLAPLNSKKDHYFGHVAKFWGVNYNTGDAGYVLSDGALASFQKSIGNEKCLENSYWNREDYYLGKYLKSLNITPINVIDEESLSMFHPYSWYHAFFPGEGYFKNSAYPYNCCSKKSISFQAVEGEKMYTYNYLLYKLQIFSTGTKGNVKRNVSEIEDKKVWKKFLKERSIIDENISSDDYYKLWENLIHDPNSFAQNMKKENLFD